MVGVPLQPVTHDALTSFAAGPGMQTTYLCKDARTHGIRLCERERCLDCLRPGVGHSCFLRASHLRSGLKAHSLYPQIVRPSYGILAKIPSEASCAAFRGLGSLIFNSMWRHSLVSAVCGATGLAGCRSALQEMFSQRVLAEDGWDCF